MAITARNSLFNSDETEEDGAIAVYDIMRGLTAAFVLLILTFAISAAEAAEIGECGTPEAITAKLKAEDQHSIASAQQVTNDKRLYAMIFTMSTDRKSGYILQADKPLGDQATKICVYNRMADIRLFDARKAGTPPGVLLKAPEADAFRRCDELAAQGKFKRGACSSLNTMIRRTEPIGERVVIQAFLTQKKSDGTYGKDGTLATLSGRIGGSINDYADDPAKGIMGDIIYSSLPEGASVLNAVLAYVEYTPYALSLL